MEKAVHVYLPKWAAVLYSVLAIVLVPWIFNLAQNLPSKHVTHHWDLVWVGFDGIMLFVIFLTLYFMMKQLVWVVISASVLATLFMIDAWFDILTSRPGREQKESIAFGIIEITLGILTYWLVYHIVHSSTPEKTVKLIQQHKQSS
jgi:hypothetical protein